MIEQIGSRLGRPTLFVAAGLAIGVLLAPSFGGGDGAQAVTTYTRAVSCQGLNWEPIRHFQKPDEVGTRRTSIDTGYYVCRVDLPHKAVVTRVRFTLYDLSASGNVNECALVRAGLETATADTAQLMAAVGTTVTGPPGIQRLSDTSISYATVDNMKYAYYLQCQIVAAGSGVTEGIYGADITYKITAANG